jgi:hypothetical protein
MSCSTSLIPIALAAAALVPAAGARTLPHASDDPITVPNCWVVYTDDLGVPWYAPDGNCPEQARPVDNPPRAIASGADATGSTSSPYSGWIVVTDDLGVQWLVPVAYAAPATVGAPRAVTAVQKPQARKPSKAKQRGFWGMVTDNSPSQNRVAPRKVSVTRHLASTLWTAPR